MADAPVTVLASVPEARTAAPTTKPKRLRGGETPRLPSAKETAKLIEERFGKGPDRKPGSIRLDANAATGEVYLVYVDDWGDETARELYTPPEPSQATVSGGPAALTTAGTGVLAQRALPSAAVVVETAPKGK